MFEHTVVVRPNAHLSAFYTFTTTMENEKAKSCILSIEPPIQQYALSPLVTKAGCIIVGRAIDMGNENVSAFRLRLVPGAGDGTDNNVRFAHATDSIARQAEVILGQQLIWQGLLRAGEE
jgi:hypothetical protein